MKRLRLGLVCTLVAVSAAAAHPAPVLDRCTSGCGANLYRCTDIQQRPYAVCWAEYEACLATCAGT